MGAPPLRTGKVKDRKLLYYYAMCYKDMGSHREPPEDNHAAGFLNALGVEKVAAIRDRNWSGRIIHETWR